MNTTTSSWVTGDTLASTLTGDTTTNTVEEVSATVYNATAVYLGLLTFFGIFNNGLVLFLYARYRNLRNPINMFLVNISVGDLSVSIFGSPFTFASNVARRWLFGPGGCTWYAFIVTVCGTEQIVALAAVSIHRCCLVVRPFTAQKMNTRWGLLFISMTWLYSLIVSLPPAFGWSEYVLEGTGTACSVNWYSNAPGTSSYIIFIFVMVLAIPLSLIIGSYSLLIYAVKKIGSSEAAQSSQHKADKKVTILVVVMITCFLVAWSPYSIFALYVAASKDNKVSVVGATLPAMFAKACTVYNPIIYFLINKQFKEAFIDLMCCGRNPFSRDDEPAGNTGSGGGRTGTAIRAATSRRGQQEPTGARSQLDNPNDISVNMETQMSEIGVTPATTRRHIKTADWGSKPSCSQQQQVTSLDRESVTKTQVEVLRVEEADKSEEPTVVEKKALKRQSKSSRSSKVCPVEEPDNEAAPVENA
ncbi:pinopsin-like [Asterias rubens]|uniref:pinopsin-like n=1 Tax=Asterias rubens TaxID=7604 RepID=UPI001455BB59|nr:pinopsin-like [Asterias rubens]